MDKMKVQEMFMQASNRNYFERNRGLCTGSKVTVVVKDENGKEWVSVK